MTGTSVFAVRAQPIFALRASPRQEHATLQKLPVALQPVFDSLLVVAGVVGGLDRIELSERAGLFPLGGRFPPDPRDRSVPLPYPRFDKRELKNSQISLKQAILTSLYCLSH